MGYPTPNVSLPIPLEHFMINVHACGRPGPAEPVQTNPLAYFLLRPRVVVRPCDQLLINPRQQCHGAVRKHCPNRLGSSPHDMKIVAAVLLVVLRRFQAGLFLGRVQIQHVRHEESYEAEGRFGQRWWHSDDKVEMQCKH